MDFANLDTSLLLFPLMLMMLGLAAITWVAMLGGSLQFSLWFLMERSPSYLRCLAMALVFVAINVSVFVVFQFALGPQPWYVSVCYQLMLQMLLMMAVARCNPVAAFFAAICHAFFSSLGTAALILIMFFTCGSAISDAMKQKKELARQAAPSQNVNPYAQ